MIAVSVVVAAKDAAETIGTALRSALDQTLTAIEIVLVDDASADGTVDTASAVANGDPRLRILRLSRNLGPAGARNAGIAAANGRFVAILDADDTYAPTRLARLVGLLEETGADIASDDLLLVDGESGTPIGPMFGRDPLPARLDAATYVRADLPDAGVPRRGSGFLKPLVSRAFLAAHGLVYPETMRFAEDYAFALACLRAGADWRTSPEPLYRYALHDGSLTARHRAADLEALRAADEAALASLPDDAGGDLREALSRHLDAVRRRAVWARFVEDYRAGAVGAALKGALADATTARHVAEGCLGHLRRFGVPRPPGRAHGARR